MRALVLFLSLLLAAPAGAQLTKASPPVHTHASATQGGATLGAHTVTGSMTFSGSGLRVKGDLSNATPSARLMFQAATLNAATRIGVIPNGTSDASFVDFYSSSDPDNSHFLSVGADALAGTIGFASGKVGSGVTRDFVFLVDGTEKIRIATTGTLSSSKACASGFTRIGPNYCANANLGTFVAWADATACTGRATETLPSDAKAVLLGLNWQVFSNNAVGLRQNRVFFYADTACSQTSSILQMYTREQVATAAGTVLAQHTHTVVVPLTATSTFRTSQDNAGGNGNSDVVESFVIGYYD